MTPEQQKTWLRLHTDLLKAKLAFMLAGDTLAAHAATIVLEQITQRLAEVRHEQVSE